MNLPSILAAAALAAAAAFPVCAQQMKTAGGMVINIGIVAAIAAEHVDAQHGLHKGGHGGGMEHIVVALAEEKGGARIANAEVSIQLKNPKGKLQAKPLMALTTAGYPDYSEVFAFDWSGKYTVRVLIMRKGAARPVEASFTFNRVL